MDCRHLHIDPLTSNRERQDFSCIYKIVSKITGRHYIGSAKHFGIRRRNHVHQLSIKKHHSIKLQNHVNKHGIHDLFFVIIEKLTWNELVFDREQYYLDTTNPYFNILKNARGVIGRKATPETIQKLIKSHLGKKPTEDSLKKRQKTMKDLLSDLTAAQKTQKTSVAVNFRKKKVQCNQTKIVFESIAEAERQTGCDNICAILNGKRNHSKGLTFKYYNNDLQ